MNYFPLFFVPLRLKNNVFCPRRGVCFPSSLFFCQSFFLWFPVGDKKKTGRKRSYKAMLYKKREEKVPEGEFFSSPKGSLFPSGKKSPLGKAKRRKKLHCFVSLLFFIPTFCQRQTKPKENEKVGKKKENETKGERKSRQKEGIL